MLGEVGACHYLSLEVLDEPVHQFRLLAGNQHIPKRKLLTRMLQDHGDCIQKCALVLGKEFVFCLGGAERIEDGSYALLEFAIRGIEGVVLLGNIRMRRVDHPHVRSSTGGERQIPDLQYKFLVAFPVKVNDGMATTNVLVDDGEQQVRLAGAALAGKVGLHGALVVRPINWCAVILITQECNALPFRFLCGLASISPRHTQPWPGPLLRQQLRKLEVVADYHNQVENWQTQEGHDRNRLRKAQQ